MLWSGTRQAIQINTNKFIKILKQFSALFGAASPCCGAAPDAQSKLVKVNNNNDNKKGRCSF
jgi:hypothetical protein